VLFEYAADECLLQRHSRAGRVAAGVTAGRRSTFGQRSGLGLLAWAKFSAGKWGT
jgi:hypothetical protein